MKTIKKRTIISLIVTILILISANKYWLIFKPVFIGMNFEGNGNYILEARLGKDKKFKKYKSDHKYINTTKKEAINFQIEKKPSAAKIKLVVIPSKINIPFTVSDININDNLRINDFKDFEVSGANILNKSNKLTLEPFSNEIIIDYSKDIKNLTPIEFDVMVFIIILVLAFLLAYKLSNYIAEFNTAKGKSKTEIVFLTAFFIFLFIPASNINQDLISERENRILVKWKPFISNKNEINFDFGKNYNEWFNDRFYLRKDFIRQYYSIISNFKSEYFEDRHIIYNKKSDFSYNKAHNSVNMFLKQNIFTKDEIDIIYKNMSELQKFCKANDIKLFVILSNDKESIYPEFYPNYYKPYNNPSRLQQVKETLKSIPNLKVISMEESLLNKKKEQLVFEPYDTHLNSLGAYIEYSLIIKELNKEYPNIKPLNLSDIEITKTEAKCDSLPPKKYINKNFEYAEIMKVKNPSASITNKANIKFGYTLFEYENKKPVNNLNAIIVGDSFQGRYRDVLAQNFHTYKSLGVGHGEQFILDSDIKKSFFAKKPDILFVETTERFLQRLLELDTFYDKENVKYWKN